MNQNMIIGIVMAIVVVGGGAWYLSAGSDDSMGNQDNKTTESNTGNSTFAALVARDGSRTCTVTVAGEGSSSEGTMYISNGEMRGDFTSSVNGQLVTAHMIQADGYMYSWSDAATQGVKISLAQSQQGGSSQNQGVDPNANVDYDCSAWTPDQSKFDVPSNVTFMELSASGMPSNVPSGMMPSAY